MKKLVLGTILLALVSFLPVTAIAEVNVSIGIGFPLPPVIVFPAPPQVIVLPDASDVYVAPFVEVDLFFWNGWWWRPWEGRWYRSRYYDRGWGYYSSVPRFYYDVDPHWRGYYRERNWYGHPWNYQPIPHQRLQKNWKSWRDNRHWERQRAWNVQGYKPRPQQQRQQLRTTRQQEYQQRPEVRLHQQEQQRQRQQVQQQQQQRKQVQQQPQRKQVEQQKQDSSRRCNNNSSSASRWSNSSRDSSRRCSNNSSKDSSRRCNNNSSSAGTRRKTGSSSRGPKAATGRTGVKDRVREGAEAVTGIRLTLSV